MTISLIGLCIVEAHNGKLAHRTETGSGIQARGVWPGPQKPGAVKAPGPLGGQAVEKQHPANALTAQRRIYTERSEAFAPLLAVAHNPLPLTGHQEGDLVRPCTKQG